MLRELLGKIPEASSMNVSDASVGETNVTAVTYDSRQAGPGSVFVALRGANADGASFARDALNRGAVAVDSQSQRRADNVHAQQARPAFRGDHRRTSFAVEAPASRSRRGLSTREAPRGDEVLAPSPFA